MMGSDFSGRMNMPLPQLAHVHCVWNREQMPLHLRSASVIDRRGEATFHSLFSTCGAS